MMWFVGFKDVFAEWNRGKRSIWVNEEGSWSGIHCSSAVSKTSAMQTGHDLKAQNIAVLLKLSVWFC